MGKQRNLYRTLSWKQRCQEIIEADGNTCCECGRMPPEVILQVHHLKYIKGKKPWEYSSEDLITLCKGCHARKHNILKEIPQDGWIYEGYEDLGGLWGTCDLCGSELRYEHYIYHPILNDYMSVGCNCADKLTNTDIASKNDHKMHLAEQRLHNYIRSPKWERRNKCYIFPNLDCFGIFINEKDNGFYISLAYYYYMNHKLQIGNIRSQTKYDSLIDAKKKIYHEIKNGSVIKYLKEHKKPLPVKNFSID